MAEILWAVIDLARTIVSLVWLPWLVASTVLFIGYLTEKKGDNRKWVKH